MKTISPSLYFLIMCVLLVSCGKSGGGSKSGAIRNPITEDKPSAPVEFEMSGAYLAELKPLNVLKAGTSQGAFTFARWGNEIVGDVRLSGGHPSILHAQSVHIGTACPTEADDLNKDGVIDFKEGTKVFGKILIPLDGDLSSQRMDSGIFPLADEYGSYLYSETAIFEQFITDLKEEDLNPEDNLVNLFKDEKFNLVGKVVVILGVAETTELPVTVGSDERLANFQTLPVACGIITKVEKTPGEVDDDVTEFEVPTGETIGGSGGEDDGFIRGTSETPPDITSNGTTTAGAPNGAPENYGNNDSPPSAPIVSPVPVVVTPPAPVVVTPPVPVVVIPPAPAAVRPTAPDTVATPVRPLVTPPIPAPGPDMTPGPDETTPPAAVIPAPILPATPLVPATSTPEPIPLSAPAVRPADDFSPVTPVAPAATAPTTPPPVTPPSAQRPAETSGNL
ncbi:MAG TPA: hypothetical protein VNJ01_07555 [Bacteriovoracaceae bacterium]|nr:hypothetical protein [Bacteriovoracaceae bacterium]